MKRIRNQKGFTLVELLVAVAILGIITGMSIPLIRNVRLNNEQRKYNSYGDSLISATKLYVDSYGQDLFGYKKTGCALVSYQQLKDKGLIKDFSDKNMSCNSDDTLVRVVKMNKQYGYSYQLYCGVEGADGKADSAEFKSSSTSKKVSEVIKKHNDDTDKDDDNDGFSDAACNYLSSMDIRISPESSTTKAESHSPKVTLMSSTGINPGSSIQYAWVDVDSKDTIPEIDYNAITDWKTANFTVDSQDSQMQKILSATDSIVLSKPKIIQTPSSAPAYYVLVLKIDNFRDLEGEYWKNEDNETNPYKIAGIYNVGKKYTITYDNNGGNGCTSSSVLKEKNTNTKWGDNNSLCTPTRDKYVFTGWNTSQDGTGTTITNDTIVENDLKVYAQWRNNHVIIKLNSNGGTLASSHNSAFTLNGNSILLNGNEGIQYIDYGSSIGTNGLVNWNNPSYLNLTKGEQYFATKGKEWNTKPDGTGTAYNQNTNYQASDFCDASNGDCVVTLYLDWSSARVLIGKEHFVCPVDKSEMYTNCKWINNGTDIENNHMVIHNVELSDGGIVNIDVGLYANRWKGNHTPATGAWGKICLQKGNGTKGDDSCDYQLTDKVDLSKWLVTGATVHRETFHVPLTNLSAGNWRIVVPREESVEGNWYHSFTNSNEKNNNGFIITILE